MLSRRSFGLVAASLAVCTATALSAFGQSAQKLFFIQRSKNANEVHYDARVLGDGNLDPKNPVDGYWLNKAEDGSRRPQSPSSSGSPMASTSTRTGTGRTR